MTDVDTGADIDEPTTDAQTDTQTNQPNLNGTWVFDHDDGNFENFLRENGAPWIARKMAVRLTPSQTINQDGDKFHIQIKTLIFTQDLKFTVGEETETPGHAGIPLKLAPSWDGNKLVLAFTSVEKGKAKDQWAIRELEGDELKQTMKIADVTTVRYFKKQA